MYYDPKESGYRIQNLRIERGMTQEALAEKLNLSASMMSKIERGIKGISIDFLIEIAVFFSVSTDYLLLGYEIPQKAVADKMDNLESQFETMKNQFTEAQMQLDELKKFIHNSSTVGASKSQKNWHYGSHHI